jgi:hypothetical protein
MLRSDGEPQTRRISGGGWARDPDNSRETRSRETLPGRPLRTVVVDADALARRHLRQLLEGDPDVELVAECDAGAPSVELRRPGA